MGGYLDRLELHNFKSYGGDVVVGPFRKGFNCIVGTNGSGKSNSMDAISFVLGVRTSQLRGNQLRDLVYRNSSAEDDDPAARKAHVRMVYVTGEGDERVFHRGVTLGGASEYKVDGAGVNMAVYNERLAEIGVLVKARNFLVFQNEVEGIASKSPRDLTGMFENISGSAEVKERYETARGEKEVAENEVTDFWRRRKGMAAEKRQCKEQKDEADKFRALQEVVAKGLTEKALFELFFTERDARDVQAEIDEDEAVLNEIEEKLTDKESENDAQKKEVSDLEKTRGQKGKKIKRLQKEIEALLPVTVRHESEVAALTRRIKGDEVALEKASKESERRAEKLAVLEGELVEATATVTLLEKNIVAAEEASVTPAAMAEYKSLKDAALVRTAALQQETATADQAADVALKLKESVVAEMETAKSRRDQLAAESDAHTGRVADLQRLREEAKAELKAAEDETSRNAEMANERIGIRSRLEMTVNETTQALRDAKADIHENSHRRKFDEALETMMRMFPGVKGRLSDLCKPTQDRYREAVAVIFGRMMDAIVVDNQKTGQECIAYLKEQRVGSATFIPLEGVRPRPVDERLRRLGGTAALAVDVVEHDENIATAILYAAGNAVVCDTLDEARVLRYDGGNRIKVCSLDGTLINKAGFMTGGNSRGDARAGKWDRKEIDTLKKRRAAAQNELSALGPAAADRRITSDRSERVDSLRRKVQILESDRAEAMSSLKRIKQELAALDKQIKSLRPEVDAATEGCRVADKKQAVLQARMAGVESEVFGGFTERNGVGSVQEFEEQFIRKSETFREQKLEAETKQSRLTSQVKYERSKSKNSAVSRTEKKIAEQCTRLEVAESNLENMQSKEKEIESRLQKLKDEQSEIAASLTEKKEALAEVEQSSNKDVERRSTRKKSVAKLNNKLKALQSEREELLTSCQVERIFVPLVGGGCIGGDNNDADDGDVEMEHQDDGNDDGNDDVGDDDSGDDDDDAHHDDAMSDGQSSGRKKKKKRRREDDSVAVDPSVKVDFLSLPRRSRSTSKTPEERKGHLEALVEEIDSARAQLGSLNPNMRAGEHMTDVSGRLSQLDKEAEQAKTRAKTAVEEFETAKEERQELFNECFTHVADKISDVYKQLTRSNNYPMGGTAYLSVEQQDEPYLAGVKFNAMPPTKRFRDMEQLSGGERTVAALSLLFAIHDFKPSPFFILDEVDAALDTGNVSKVSTYVQSRAPELQTIVITLKDAFFEKADALVGIYRDTTVNASRILTMDLSPFDGSRAEEQGGDDRTHASDVITA